MLQRLKNWLNFFKSKRLAEDELASEIARISDNLLEKLKVDTDATIFRSGLSEKDLTKLNIKGLIYRLDSRYLAFFKMERTENDIERPLLLFVIEYYLQGNNCIVESHEVMIKSDL